MMNRGNTAALDAQTEIDEMLDRLATLSADHPETSAADIDLGRVKTLTQYHAQLRAITDIACSEGAGAAPSLAGTCWS